MDESIAGEWRHGWKLVAAAATGFSFLSLITISLGVFMEPLGAQFGWSRTLMSAGIPITGLSSVLLSPLVGTFVDRFGSRRLALPGLLLATAATCAFGLADGSTVQWLLLWTFYSFATLCISVNVWSTAVAGVFASGRGLALGLTLAGTAVTQAVTPPLATWLIAEWGWRNAFFILGLGWGSVSLLLCLFFFFDKHDRPPPQRTTSDQQPDSSDMAGLTIAQAWRDSGLWRIAASTLLIMIFTMGFLIHQVPILKGVGIPSENAAWLAGLGGVAGIVGKVSTGGLMDRFRPAGVGGLTLGLAAMTFSLLLYTAGRPSLVVAAVLINGYAAGAKLQICAHLTSLHCGLRHYGAIFGFMGSLIALGSATGPLLAGLAYDLTGGYTPFMIAGFVGCLTSGLLIASLPTPRNWS